MKQGVVDAIAKLPIYCYAPETDMGWGRVSCEVLDLVNNTTVLVNITEGCKKGKEKKYSLDDLTIDFDGQITLRDALKAS